MPSSERFQPHCSIFSNFVCCGFNMKKNVAFTLISFNALKWDELQMNVNHSTAVSSNVSDTGSVASRSRGQLTRSKWEWTRIWTI